jgi:PST family polysaccharide transporter
MLVLCAAAAPLGFVFRDPGLGPVLAALSAILVLCGMLAVPNARIARRQRFLVFAAAEVAATLVSAAAAIASALAGLGAWSLVVQQLTLWSIKAVWVFGASGFRPALVCDLRAASKQLHFGVRLVGANISDLLMRNGPVLIIGATLSTALVGRYAMAAQIARLPELLIVGPVYLSVFTSAARAQAAGLDPAGMTRRTLRLSLLTLAPLFAGLALTADLISRLLLGPKWAGAETAMAALSPGILFGCVITLLYANLQALGRADAQLRLSLVTTAATLAGAAVGVRFGLVGAAVGVSVGMSLATPLCAVATYRKSSLSLGACARDAAGPILAVTIMIAAVLVCRRELAFASRWAQLAGAVAVGALVYGVAVAGLFGRSAWRDIRALLPTVRPARFAPSSGAPAPFTRTEPQPD